MAVQSQMKFFANMYLDKLEADWISQS